MIWYGALVAPPWRLRRMRRNRLTAPWFGPVCFFFEIWRIPISIAVSGYTTYVPLIYCQLGDYITYHLLREPGNSIDMWDF